MASRSRNHWVEPLRPVVLDVLSGRSEEVETHHLAMGLHPGGDGAECTAATGRNARDEICGLTPNPVGAGLLAIQAPRSA